MNKTLLAKTQELQKTNQELEQFNRMAVNREGRMIQLKREVNELLEELKRPSRYDVSAMLPSDVENES